MTDGRRASAILLFAALLAASPAAAQNNAAADLDVPPPPVTRNDTVGPEQLRDFSLPGTVTRRSEEPQPRPSPPPASSAPARSAPAPTREQARVGQPGTPPAGTVSAPAAEAARSPQPTQPELPSPAPSLSQDLPPAAPAPAPTPGLSDSVVPAPLPDAAVPAEVDGSTTRLWPWLLLGLLAVAGALFWFMRRRSPAEQDGYGELAFAGAAPAPAPEPAPQPVPRPTPAPPPLRPAAETPPPLRPAAESPPPSGPVGVVSSRLRPWVDLEFAPVRAMLTDTEIVLDFEIAIFNSGSVPARQVLVEAILLNAGDEQERDLATFFARGDLEGEGIEAVPPLGRLALNSQVRLPRTGMREYAVEDRRLFVPVIAFNAAYRWSGGTGRTSASFLVGLASASSDKLGPFRLDTGPREWRTLAARLLPTGQRR